jgi:hypothetical protein
VTHQNKETSPTRFTEAMVEIVARAIRPEIYNPDEDARADAMTNQFRDDLVKSIARAALTALTDSGSVILPREATVEMLRAAFRVHDPSYSDYSAIYRAMRDAALGA